MDFYDGMAFYEDRKGYVIGDPVNGKWMILKTSNQGETWTILETSPKANEGEAVFAASGSSICVDKTHIWFASGGSSSRIFRSSDSGLHWETSPTPIAQGVASQGIFSIVRLG